MNSPKTMTPIEYITAGLRHLDYLALHFRPNEIEGLPVETAFVPLFKDKNHRDFELQILLLNSFFEAAAQESGLEAQPPRAYTFQFVLRCPYTVTTARLPDIHRLSFELSALMEIGTLGASVEDGVYYRYQLLQASPQADLSVVLELIEYLKARARNFHPLWVALLEESKALPELLQQLETSD